MPQLSCPLPTALWEPLQSRALMTQDPVSHIVTQALAGYFNVPPHTLY